MSHSSEPTKVIRASDSSLVIASMSDVSDAVGATFEATGLLLTENDLTPAFFDLRSGIAGELFQKFTNYRLRLALVVPDPATHGERFSELAYEHRQHNVQSAHGRDVHSAHGRDLIRFFALEADALRWLESE